VSLLSSRSRRGAVAVAAALLLGMPAALPWAAARRRQSRRRTGLPIWPTSCCRRSSTSRRPRPSSRRSSTSAPPRAGRNSAGFALRGILQGLFQPRHPAKRQAEAKPRKATSLGSGFVIDATGYIVTNNHVIADADEITVILSDDTNLKAESSARHKTDVAVLKVKTTSP